MVMVCGSKSHSLTPFILMPPESHLAATGNSQSNEEISFLECLLT